MVASVYAEPRAVSFEECEFYHVMDFPDHGTVSGQWDLRGKVDEYLGNVGLKGKRVLEIGPASGFLAVEMERRGAEVVSIEVPDDPGWDFVPYPPEVLDPIRPDRAAHLRRIKNSYWFTHKAFNSKARIVYGDVYDLPSEIGMFDVAIMTAVLLHTRHPLSIVEQCSKRAKTLVIVDLFDKHLEGETALCRLHPTPENKFFDTWWGFSTSFFTQFVSVLGYRSLNLTRHWQKTYSGPVEVFTIVANR